METVLGIDLGTTNFKVGAFDREGRLTGLGRVPVVKDRGDDGIRCEVPSDRFWKTVRQAVAGALDEGESVRGEVSGIGYSSQTNSFLVLDIANRPLTPLLLWQDLRAKPASETIKRLWRHDAFLRTTGLGVTQPDLTIAKLVWLQENKPQLWHRVGRILGISDYLVFGLTGAAIGDEDTASMLGIWDLQSHRWWREALKMLSIEARWLPRLARPGAMIAPLSNAGSDRLGGGIPPGIPLAAGGLDHHLSALGAGLGSLADMIASNGTALCCLHVTGDYQPRAGCCMGIGFKEGTYTQFAFSENGASGLEWYQRRFAPDLSIETLLDMAAAVAPGADGLVAKPCTFQFDAREGFLNEASRHTHGHHVRAILESTAATLVELVECLTPSRKTARILATGGGVRSPLWLQIKADMLGVPIVQADCVEPACRGAAMCAAVAAGWFPSLNAVAQAWITPGQVFSPRPEMHEKYQSLNHDRSKQEIERRGRRRGHHA